MIRRGAGLLLVAALLTGCGDDGGGGAADDAIVLEFENGDLVGGSRQESVTLGQTVTMTVEGEVDDEVHVHGYDLYIRPLEGERELVFDALIPGTFEVELEGSGRLLLRMTVS